MGTDIHGFWEARMKDGSWVAVRDISDGYRNYEWFGIIAGVRRPVRWGKGVLEPWLRGVPGDASTAWKEYTDPWGSDMHGKTWLTLDEVRIAKKMYIDHAEPEWREYKVYHLDDPESYESDPEYRFLVIPTPQMHIEELTMGVNCEDHSFSQVTIPWQNTLDSIVDPDRPFNECVRLVIGFDS